MKSMLLTAINAKYIHSNPAIYSLRAYAGAYGAQVELAEYTINQSTQEILGDIYRKRPEFVAFSCYIWNIKIVGELIRELALVLPGTVIWVGGPEVSYDARAFLEAYPQVKGVMRGEGERTFLQLCGYYLEGKGSLGQILGITFRTDRGEILSNEPQPPVPMDEIPFPYGEWQDTSHKIVYYESSRGCPFSCSYCLSSIDKSVRFRSLKLVTGELQVFLDRKVPQVKFVDRTFNCSHRHAMGVWQYIKEHDNGITNFHFEIGADLFCREELELLSGLRPGLVQLEIGVQSVNPRTIEEIRRTMDLPRLSRHVEYIRKGANIHQHLDLIAGLPYEDQESFIRSFNQVYAMKPDQLQLGFLKVLKGSAMEERALEYGLKYQPVPPYEVLSTRWLSYGEILELKGVEEMVEVYYNSHQFSQTVQALEPAFASPYHLFQALDEYYERHGLKGIRHSRLGRLEILRDFALEARPEEKARYEEALLLDLYLRENSKTRPAWAPDLSPYKEQIALFYKEEASTHRLLPGYEGCTYRQLRAMTHVELFERAGEGVELVLFDYQRRDPLTYNAWTYRRIL